MGFWRTWFVGYYSPARVVEGLASAPAPQWGVCAQVLRALLDGLVLYLPLAILGRQPSTPPYLNLFPAEGYYGTLAWLAPPFLVAQWLFLSALLHVLLRLLGRHSDLDQILNITGMAALIVGAFLVAWDWVWILAGWHDEVLLGLSHMVLVIWAAVITVLGLKRILDVPVWLGVVLNVVWVAAGWPLSAIVMRSPV
jgi:hypothetical protein